MKDQKKESSHPVFDLNRDAHKIVFPVEFDLVDLAKDHGVFPLKVVTKRGRKKLLLAMRDPEMKDVIGEVEFRANLPVIAVQTSNRDIEWLIRRYYHREVNAEKPVESKEDDITQDAFEQIPYVRGAY